MNHISATLPVAALITLISLAGCSGSTPETAPDKTAQTERRVTESDIVGRWQLVVEVDDLIATESGAEHPIVQSVLSGVGGVVRSVIEAIDIRFEFHADRTMDITVYSKEVTRDGSPEVESLTWRINGNGELIIDDIRHDKINISNDGVWVMNGDRLILVDDGKDRPEIHLRRVTD